MNSHNTHNLLSGLVIIALVTLSFAFSSCNPEAKWETEGVEVKISVEDISAGFVECHFTPNKDAYYLIDLCEPWPDYNPVYNSKQFMQLALDSAYADYLSWRNKLLRAKEFNVAPFSSHSLQYGEKHHFFTGLLSEEDYWLFAFPVDPVSMQPAGPLNLIPIKTLSDSKIDVHFEYRVYGKWDYIYPVDSLGKIYDHFPYICITRDSAELAATDSITTEEEAVLYFVFWCMDKFLDRTKANVKYGVYADKKDGIQAEVEFEEGHTYYTGISGYDGSFRQATIYRFKWTGDSCQYYFHDTDSANITNLNGN